MNSNQRNLDTEGLCDGKGQRQYLRGATFQKNSCVTVHSDSDKILRLRNSFFSRRHSEIIIIIQLPKCYENKN
jgi:hypothetical protein